MKNKVKKMLYIIAVSYLILVAFLYVAQRKMIFFPDNNKPDVLIHTADNIREIMVQTTDGLSLNAWLHPADEGQPTLVFFHGNAGHYGHRIFKAEPYADQGYGFVLAGYRGYGGNAGKPSEEGFYKDARAYIQHVLDSGVAEENIILYGESIGTGVAVQMATEFPNIKALILESPYTSLPDVAARRYFFVPVRLLMKDRFDSLSKIENVRVPLLVVQGLEDRIIPPKFGQQLFEEANEPKEILQLKNHGHNDMPDSMIAKTVIDFLQE